MVIVSWTNGRVIVLGFTTFVVWIDVLEESSFTLSLDAFLEVARRIKNGTL